MSRLPIIPSRRWLVATALALSLTGTAGAAYAVGSGAPRTTFYACEASNGFLSAISTSPPTCQAKTTLVSFTAGETTPIADGAVTNSKITGPIDGDKIGPGIDADNITTGTLPSDRIASVDGSKIGTGIAGGNINQFSIGHTQLANMSVTERTIADEAVITRAIADNTITSNKIVDGAITNADLAQDSIGAGNIQNNAVNNAKIADGAVTPNKVTAWAQTGGEQTVPRTNTDSEAHLVLLTGQVQLDCSSCSGRVDATWQLVKLTSKGREEISPEYKGTLSPEAPYLTASVSHTDVLAPNSSATYALVTIVGGGMEASQKIINVVDLGRK